MTLPEMPNHAPTQAAAATDRKPVSKTLMIAGAGFLVGAMLGVAGTAISISAINDANAKAAAKAEADAQAAASKIRPLKEAAAGCDIIGETGAKLGDGDHSLALDSKGNEDYAGLPMEKIDCVLNNLHVPDFIRAEMGKTRALDGTQRESWDKFSVSWTYHPDEGLTIGLVEK
ncbi:hypothetical protein ACFVTM_08860 [Arthrobacter sp. NPDC058130]|uniref:hypothetical protein n=1 Tax=Arthrobacter sp. NPDC058130 TaxID=3346353 RepID=UPI0036F0D658